MKFSFSSFRGRILSFFLGLLVIIQLASFYFIDLANSQNAMLLVGEALEASARSFNNQISVRSSALTQAGRILSSDFAFKSAFSTGSTATISSALDNHRRRIGASLILLLTLNGEVITGSGKHANRFRDDAGQIAFKDFFDTAVSNGESSGMVSFDDAIYSVIAVPLLTPVPSAWIVMGFNIDERFIQQLQQDSHSDVSIITRIQDQWFCNISTLPDTTKNGLLISITGNTIQTGSIFNASINQRSYFTYINELPAAGDVSLYAVLQRATDEALSPYYRLRIILLVLFLIALTFSILIGGGIASSVTKPVKSLVNLARKIQQGNYENTIEVRQNDEIGQLADAFNEMSKGLYERDKVRNLLGKVISPQIAEELIKKDVQLGGEEREITILFTDLRNFTGLSETRAPAEVLTILNEYLTRMTSVIDSYGGVVDKYIGDAIMALFGAPIHMTNHAENAVNCAIDMNEAMDQLNHEFWEKGWPVLTMGIGINTGNVVVGNMGSRDRLNYTALGDNVNLASRLEAITKEHQIPIIVSESTYRNCKNINFIKIGTVNVKGKQESVTIYSPDLLST